MQASIPNPVRAAVNAQSTASKLGFKASDNLAELLQQLVDASSVGCLSIQTGFLSWEIALQPGRQIFATHSLGPVEKFDRHLSRLSFQQPRLTLELREQVKRKLSNTLRTLSPIEAESSLIQWLVDQKYLEPTAATLLAKQLSVEALETALLLSDFSQHFLKVELAPQDLMWPTLEETLECCKARLQAWQWLGPEITSPYQRPCILQSEGMLAPEQYQLFGNLLSGLSFRQLSGVFNQEDLQIAQQLKPLIQAGRIQLLGPQSPFDQFPTFQPLPDQLTGQDGTTTALHAYPGSPLSSDLTDNQQPSGPGNKSKKSATPASWLVGIRVASVGAIALGWVLLNNLVPNGTAPWLKLGNQRHQDHQASLQRNPKDLYALVKLNNLYVGRGEYTQAVPILKQIIQLQPNNRGWQITLARVYDLAGQANAAEQVYDQILRQDKDYFQALVGKARLRYNQADQAAAQRFYQQAIQVAPSDQSQQDIRTEMSRLQSR
jgi:tetratricopeptide (TPR) repeat protein